MSSVFGRSFKYKCLSKYLATITTDLKLSNIIVGLSNNASCYPCIWCDVSKDDLSSCGKLRTAKSCHSNFDDWCKSGKNKRKAKNFKNCINSPMFYSKNDNDNKPILHTMPPPQLHLFLGTILLYILVSALIIFL